jgi:hypothetical protein
MHSTALPNGLIWDRAQSAKSGRLTATPAVAPGIRQLATGRVRVGLKRDDFSLNRHPALASCLSMIFSENRCTLFGIML